MTTSLRTFPGRSRLHLGLSVRDVEASVRFYRDLFGVEPAKQFPDYARFDVLEPSLNLSLSQGSPTPPTPGLHFGVEVRDPAVHADMVRALEKSGLPTKVEEEVTCCYALQRKIWVHDPDGHAWEFFLVLADSEQRDEKSTECCVQSCCTTP